MKNLKIDESTGLVLEGGGMRGVFTCGVLDYFMDHDVRPVCSWPVPAPHVPPC